MKKLIIFTILILAISSSADEWKQDEWLLAKPIILSLTSDEKSKIGKNSKETKLTFESFYKRIADSLPENFDTRANAEIITVFGTSKWEKVQSSGEFPAIKNEIPEYSVTFVAKYWISSEKQEAELRFGSDDAAKVWHNNNVVFKYMHNSVYEPDKNTIPVILEKGTNIFVFAVIN